ncbi:MAG: hypothetical protein INR71_03490 [Terriglobus roseus]|nr:hypothetical protein [Terriglobus roseus]
MNHDANVLYTLENENKNLRGELGSCWQHLQRLEPNNHHVFGSYTNHLAVEAQQQQQQQPPPPPPPQPQPGIVRLPALPPQSLPPPFVPTNGAAPAPMEGVTTQYQ